MLIEKTTKPSIWTSPVAWTRRKIKLKFGDLIRLSGLELIEKTDFRSMTGEQFSHVIDVGVADGSPDLYERFPNAYLDLFEPHPDWVKVAQNILSQREGRLYPVALGREKGTSNLYLKGRTGSSLALDSGRGSIAVPVERLDEILSSHDIRPPCLLKIDTEGYEMAVLEGAEKLLGNIDCIAVEIHFQKPDQYEPYQLINFLAQRGFGMCEMLDFHVKHHRVICADFVFRKRNTADRL